MHKGAAAEQRAEAYLVGRGLGLIQRNYRVRGGEIDLVMRDGAVLVFVEVRQRARTDFGGAAESISFSKRARLVLAARHFLAQAGGDSPCRFDAVLIQGEELEWVKDAFDASL